MRARWATWMATERPDLFTSAPVRTRCSTVSYTVTLYAQLKRIDYAVELKGWKNCFGVSNRLSFPIR